MTYEQDEKEIAAKPYYYYHPRGNPGEKHPYGWAVAGPNLDMYVPDKGLALAIAKFLNKEEDATLALEQLWLAYIGNQNER